MTRRQLIVLCVVAFLTYTVGNILIAFLPVYALRLGASSSANGYFLAMAFGGLAAGGIVGGWLADRWQRRRLLLIVAAAFNALLLALTALAVSMDQLIFVSVLSWFSAGVCVSMINVITGLFAGEHQRGKIFGLYSSIGGLAAFLVGLVAGPMVDRWGYGGLFVLSAALYTAAALVGLLVKDREPLARTPRTASHRLGVFGNRSYLWLCFGSVLAYIAASESLLGRPLNMVRLGFDATAISSAVAASGVATIPLPFLIGWLSDRVPRKYLLLGCYLTGLIGLLILAGSAELWHFWTSAAFMSIAGVSIAVGSAYVADVLPPELLGEGISWFNATNWIGYTVGLAAAGAAMTQFGLVTTLVAGAALTALAMLLVIPLRSGGRLRSESDRPVLGND